MMLLTAIVLTTTAQAFTWSYRLRDGTKVTNQVLREGDGIPQVHVTHQKMKDIHVPAGPKKDMSQTERWVEDLSFRPAYTSFRQRLNDGSGKSLAHRVYHTIPEYVETRTWPGGKLTTNKHNESSDAQIFYQPNKPKIFTWAQRLEPKSRSGRHNKIAITCTPYMEGGVARRRYHMRHSRQGDVSHRFLQSDRTRSELNGDTTITMPQPKDMLHASIDCMTYEIRIRNNQVREVTVKTKYLTGNKLHSDERTDHSVMPTGHAQYGFDTTRTIKNMDHPSNRH